MNQTSFLSLIVIIISKYPHERVVVLLNARRSKPSYHHKFPLSMPIFSNSLEYMISYKLSPSIRIQETLNCLIVALITKREICLEFLPPSGRSGDFIDAFPSFLRTVNILVAFLFMVPLKGRSDYGTPPMMKKVY